MPTLEERLTTVETNLTEAATELGALIAELRAELEQNGFTPLAAEKLASIETKAAALKDVVPGP